MSFRDDAQLARACELLCNAVTVRGCFRTEPAPEATRYAIDIRDGRVGLSSGELIMVRAAWAFWNGDRSVALADLITTLDGPRLDAIVSLLAVLHDADAIDLWIHQREREERERDKRRRAFLRSLPGGAR